MDNWIDNIDPRLLQQNVAQMGGFISDNMQAGNTNMLYPMFGPDCAGASNTSVELAGGQASNAIDLDVDLCDFEQLTSPVQTSDHLMPVTPIRPYNSRLFRAVTPSSSLRGDANVFVPGSSWQANNTYAVLADGVPERALQYLNSGSMIRGKGGIPTPDTMSTGQIAYARQEAMLSPTRLRPRQHRTANTNNGSSLASIANPMNINGGPPNTLAAENMEVWAGDAYSVPATHTTAHLVPHAGPQAVRRSRATSVASTAGRGNWVCDGALSKPCGKRFLTKSAMTHHARCHQPPRHFCSLCESGFYYKKDLGRHMKTHAPRDRHLICNNNGCKYHTQPFSREDHLQRHERSCRYSQQ